MSTLSLSSLSSLISTSLNFSTIKEEVGDYPFSQMTWTVANYSFITKIGRGAYGAVYRAEDASTKAIVAVKKMKKRSKSTSREISILHSVHRHPNIISLIEVVTSGKTNFKHLYMVMECADQDLRSILKSMPGPLDEYRARDIMSQILQGVRHLHRNRVLHRDLKPANILLVQENRVRICDFGLARKFEDGNKEEEEPYTNTVGTLNYMSPEMLLGANDYSASVDMWSVGCIMAELAGKERLFPGSSEIEVLCKIMEVLGAPDEKARKRLNRHVQIDLLKIQGNSELGLPPNQKLLNIFPSLSSDCIDLMARLLAYDPDKRITADAALSHPWFGVQVRAKLFTPHLQFRRLSLG